MYKRQIDSLAEQQACGLPRERERLQEIFMGKTVVIGFEQNFVQFFSGITGSGQSRDNCAGGGSGVVLPSVAGLLAVTDCAGKRNSFHASAFTYHICVHKNHPGTTI